MSFPRYPNYKDSGVKWVGDVPANWEMIPIRRLIAAPLWNGIFKKKEEFGAGVLLINLRNPSVANSHVANPKRNSVSAS